MCFTLASEILIICCPECKQRYKLTVKDKLVSRTEELALRSALEALQDPKLSELLAGARVDPERNAVGLAEEDYRENLLALETRDSTYLIEQLMNSYARLPGFLERLEF